MTGQRTVKKVKLAVPYTVSYCSNCSKVFADNRDTCYTCGNRRTVHHTEVRIHTNVPECVAKLAVKWNRAKIV
jgi:uncharacterized OB-fold protein